MYRPQFAYPLPPGPCDDQRCMYSFDAQNLPALNGTLAAGQQTGRIPLRLDKDAEFWARAISWTGPAALRLEDPDNNPLSDSDNQLQSANFILPVEFADTSGAGVVVLESPGGIFGPAGGNFVLLLANLSGVTIDLTQCVLNLHGVKRYSGEVCTA